MSTTLGPTLKFATLALVPATPASSTATPNVWPVRHAVYVYDNCTSNPAASATIRPLTPGVLVRVAWLPSPKVTTAV